MKKITLLFLTVISSYCANAQLLYTFDSVKTTSGTIDPTPVPVGTGITMSSFTATGTPPNSLAAFRFNFADWATGSTGGPADTLYALMTGLPNTAEYYEVTLTPQSGYSINGDSIKFSFQRSSTGVRTYAVRSSLDGYTLNLPAVYGAPTTNVDVQAGNVFFLKSDISTAQTRNIIVLDASFDNLTSPVTFRFYGWNSEASTGTFSIDNVNFIGSSSFIPITGVKENATVTLSLYPNPTANGMFTAEIGNSNGTSKIIVQDILGNVILSRETTSSKELVDLSGHSNGSYFLTVRNNAGSSTKKIIVTK